MSELVVVTPSYAPDAELFADLHRSVLEHTPEQTVHHVIVPTADRARFTRHSGARCRVWTYSELLPRRYVPVPHAGMWLNGRRPWPPVRGWVLQQAVKIAAAAKFDARAVLLVDSDVVLVRPTAADRFTVEGRLRLFRADGAVHAGMARHIRWHQVARKLLGLPAAAVPLLPDYVSPFNVWDPAIVAAMQRRICEVTGADWLDVFTAQLHVSEFILYGLFVDEILGRVSPHCTASTTFCHTYWEASPMDRERAAAFAGRIAPDALAMMISAKSGTPREVRQAAARLCSGSTGD